MQNFSSYFFFLKNKTKTKCGYDKVVTEKKEDTQVNGPSGQGGNRSCRSQADRTVNEGNERKKQCDAMLKDKEKKRKLKRNRQKKKRKDEENLVYSDTTKKE